MIDLLPADYILYIIKILINNNLINTRVCGWWRKINGTYPLTSIIEQIRKENY